MENIEKLLLQLLKIPSESGSEAKIGRFLMNLLSEEFSVKRIPVSPGRFNIFATSGNADIVLVAHMDTVVGQLPINADSQNIYGRGACDNKNSVASMIDAVTQAKQEGVTNFGLLLTVGEETSLDGAIAAKAYFKRNGIKPKLVVVGEPTEEKIITAQKGLFVFNIISRGVKGHGSDSANSAIHKLIQALATVMKMNSKQNIVNVGVIEGGEAPNIVAGEARASVVIRSSKTGTRERVLKLLKLKDITIDILKDVPPVKSSLGRKGSRLEVDFFTEMAFFDNSMILGAGSIRNAHSNHELISRKALVRIAGLYKNILRSGKI